MIKHRPFYIFILCLFITAQSAWAGGDAASGKRKVESCNACHGADGNSLIPSNPKLAGQGERYLLKQLKNVQTGEREIAMMVGQLDHFNDQDLADIAAFYAAQTQTHSFSEEKWVSLGREIYRNGNPDRGIPSCTGCHGPSGTGNAPAGFPMLAGQHAEYLAIQLRHFSIGNRHNDGEGKVMRDIAERMNDNEIQAVASYIAGLRP
jgi:cytochrome c553